MTNFHLAQRFERIASLLEVLGDSPFKIRAYRRVARLIAELPEPIEDVARHGRLRDLPGVGEAIAAKIEEYLQTGTIGLLEHLQEQIPEGVADLLAIPGIGPRTARLLHEQLGVASLAELEAAARSGRIRALKGMRARSEAAILEGLERLRRLAGRQPLPYVLGVAEALARALAQVAGVGATAVTGGLRRAETTVADVDLLVVTAAPADASDPVRPVAEAIRRHLGSTATVEPGWWEGTARVRVSDVAAVPIDVWVVPRGVEGLALLVATGPAAHVEEVRQRLARRGWRWDDGGRLERGQAPEERPPGAHPAGPTAEPSAEDELTGAEAAIYARAGLPWIPPELRWGEDEVRRAQRGQLPRRLVQLDDIRGDLHTHTEASDGAADVAEMARAARERGLEYLAVTDHSPSLVVARGLTPDRLAIHVARIRAVAEETGVALLAGSEVDIGPDGSLDYPDEVLAGLDWVVASIHSRLRLDEASQTQRLLAACQHPAVDVLAHPTGRLIGRREPYAVDLERVLRRAAETGTAVEINASPDRLDLDPHWVRRARELGVRIVIDTDAHSPSQLGFMRYGVLVARRAGLEPGDVLNAHDLDHLRAHRKRRPRS
ncbi:PHP domain-containing protein [Geochorda subterranea]|uniref:DNA polymerase beta n=1 Tax=Geochorda subterranea TaxID=3109564 RepID=A0ABZ1BSS1_9FIRM|nr:PHP domain-containing protein [Limnochorda sp. LNt]WRP15681.1 PHP domain-containing protein [Limnochorda sp. LNt]